MKNNLQGLRQLFQPPLILILLTFSGIAFSAAEELSPPPLHKISGPVKFSLKWRRKLVELRKKKAQKILNLPKGEVLPGFYSTYSFLPTVLALPLVSYLELIKEKKINPQLKNTEINLILQAGDFYFIETKKVNNSNSWMISLLSEKKLAFYPAVFNNRRHNLGLLSGQLEIKTKKKRPQLESLAAKHSLKYIGSFPSLQLAYFHFLPGEQLINSEGQLLSSFLAVLKNLEEESPMEKVVPSVVESFFTTN